MSDYFQSLDSIAQSRYLEKLQLIGLSIEDDPYTNSDKFIDELGHQWNLGTSSVTTWHIHTTATSSMEKP